MAKRIIKEDLSLQIVFFVYQYAKLCMLQFYFDFLDKHVDISDFQYIQMDTNSAYIGLAGTSLDEVMKPEYEYQKHQWLPRYDTKDNAVYDKRTPGLFKVEWTGDGIIASCSKTLYCFKSHDKSSCKGVNKKNNDITKDVYLSVLNTKQSQSGLNRGFRQKDNSIYTYSQAQAGFTYFYPKRKGLEDHVTTTYLDI